MKIILKISSDNMKFISTPIFVPRRIDGIKINTRLKSIIGLSFLGCLYCKSKIILEKTPPSIIG